MAGDWLKMRHDLVDDPAIDRITELTGLDAPAVLGRLFLVWRWADRQSRDGHAPVTATFLDRHAQHVGFAAAMISAGWLIEESSGVFFPNFDRHMGANAKLRADSTERKRRSRANATQPVTVTNSVTQRSRKRVTREEKRREEYSIPNGIERSATAVRPRKRTDRPAKRVPLDVELTDDLRAFATGQGLEAAAVAEEWEAFRDHEFKTPRSDWAAAWRTWARNAVKFRQRDEARGNFNGAASVLAGTAARLREADAAAEQERRDREELEAMRRGTAR